MKKVFFLFTLTFIIGYQSNAQECDSIYHIVSSYIEKSEDGRPFVSDGQTYMAFLNNEKAEFNTTLFGGTYYRIAASAGTKDDYVIFSIFDLEDNLLFSNKSFNNIPYWDFKIENTLPVRIITELDTDKRMTGCAVMMIGFLK